MSMEKPIIASDLEQIGEVLNPAVLINQVETVDVKITNELAFLCEPNSATDIVKSLRHIVDNYAKLKKLGVNARQKVLEKYTWKKHAEVILKSLKSRY